MKVFIASLGAISFLLVGYVDAGVEKRMENKNVFISESSFSLDNPFLPFVINFQAGFDLYEDSKWAIKILDVLSDGKRIIGKPSFEFFDDINIDSRRVDSEFYVYKIKFDNMVFGDLSPDGEYTLIEYSIPADTKELEINYQFVSSDGKRTDQVYRLKAFRTR